MPEGIREFPIPMRGNEPWDMLLPPAGQQVFPIPMRGNERYGRARWPWCALRRSQSP